ncbi:MAG: DUF423 domain-containing protein [Bacteroidota bacterium]
MYKQAMTAGALLAMLAVILGAFGAHGIRPKVTPEMYAVFEKGAAYHFYHSFALLITGIAYASFPFKQLRLATIFFIVGIALFSGSLYAMALLSITGTSIGPAGIITPIGGTFFILGWLFLFLGIIKKK